MARSHMCLALATAHRACLRAMDGGRGSRAAAGLEMSVLFGCTEFFAKGVSMTADSEIFQKSPPAGGAEENLPQKNAAEKTCPPDGFPHGETASAHAVGKSRDDCRELRKQLTRGTDWEYGEKHAVFLSDGGLARLRELAQPSATTPDVQTPPAAPPTPPDAEKATSVAATAAAAANAKLIAWKSPMLNRRLLIAYRPGDDPTNPLKLVNVSVSDNGNFMRGDEITAAHVKGNHFNLVGPCPRYRGEFKRRQKTT